MRAAEHFEESVDKKETYFIHERFNKVSFAEVFESVCPSVRLSTGWAITLWTIFY